MDSAPQLGGGQAHSQGPPPQQPERLSSIRRRRRAAVTLWRLLSAPAEGSRGMAEISQEPVKETAIPSCSCLPHSRTPPPRGTARDTGVNREWVGCRGPGELGVSVLVPAYRVAVRNTRGNVYKPRPQGPGPGQDSASSLWPQVAPIRASSPAAPGAVLGAEIAPSLPHHQAPSLVLKVAPSVPRSTRGCPWC